MDSIQRKNESRFLEQVALYRAEYRKSRTVAMYEDRERRHAAGEVYIAGSWVARADADRVARGLQRHEVLAFFEIVAMLVLLLATAYGVWWLFLFLLLPAIG